MFGFQRIGDLLLAEAGDQQARGFLIGGTAVITTLNGEGLQHEWSQPHSVADYPGTVSLGPAQHGEVAVIMHDGLERPILR